MWEVIVIVALVGTALYFTGRALVRSLRDDGQAGCCGRCPGCSRAAASCEPDATGKEMRNPAAV